MVKLDIHYNGTKWWYRSDQRHRSNGPVIVRPDGFQCWFWDGQKHRTDGPAIKWPDGTLEYWINGKQVSEYEIMFINGTGHD